MKVVHTLFKKRMYSPAKAAQILLGNSHLELRIKTLIYTAIIRPEVTSVGSGMRYGAVQHLYVIKNCRSYKTKPFA